MTRTSALERLRAHVEDEVAKDLQDLSRFRGHGWCSLSVEEEKVFDWRLEELPRLATVMAAFEAAVGLASADVADNKALTAALRDELPFIREAIKLFESDGIVSDASFRYWRDFAALFGIPYRVAFVYFWKMRFGEMREGHLIIPGRYHGPEVAPSGDPLGVMYPSFDRPSDESPPDDNERPF